MGRVLALQLAATVPTVAALPGATAYVAAHPEDPGAPLPTPVVKPSPTPTARPTGRIQVSPAVRATALPGITFTHVS